MWKGFQEQFNCLAHDHTGYAKEFSYDSRNDVQSIGKRKLYSALHSKVRNESKILGCWSFDIRTEPQ